MFSLFKYLKKYKFLILLIFFLIFVQSMMELLLPTIMSKVVDEGILNSDMKIISIQGLKMLGVVIVAIIVSLFSILYSKLLFSEANIFNFVIICSFCQIWTRDKKKSIY